MAPPRTKRAAARRENGAPAPGTIDSDAAAALYRLGYDGENRARGSVGRPLARCAYRFGVRAASAGIVEIRSGRVAGRLVYRHVRQRGPRDACTHASW